MRPSLACVLIFTIAAPAAAQTCVTAQRTSATITVASSGGLTIAPFAIPVAVPVATISQPAVFYSYSQYRVAPNVTSAGQLTPPAASLTAAAVLEQRCAACHNGVGAQGTFTIAAAEELSRERRVDVLDRVTSNDPRRRMPPDGQPLTPDELRALLHELVR
jgi:hypothetical protein